MHTPWAEDLATTMEAMFDLQLRDVGTYADGVEYASFSTVHGCVEVEEDGPNWYVSHSDLLDEDVRCSSFADVVWLCEILLMGGVL